MLFIFSLLAPASTQASAEIAKGVVFEDANKNGKLDTAEQGIAGILVSNGQKIAKTDSQGRYEIEVDNDTILFVIKPRNWITAIGKFNLPKFYYIHKPEGSPRRWLSISGR